LEGLTPDPARPPPDLADIAHRVVDGETLTCRTPGGETFHILLLNPAGGRNARRVE
jgi:hypothetical protein